MVREIYRAYTIQATKKLLPASPFITYILSYKNSCQIWTFYASTGHFVDKCAGGQIMRYCLLKKNLRVTMFVFFLIFN